MKITPNQKKAFYDILTAKGLDWDEFIENLVPETEDHQEYPRLFHRHSDLFFGFYHNLIFESLHPEIGGWYVEHRPGQNNMPLASFPTVKGWEEVLKLFRQWADLMLVEISSYNFFKDIKEFQEDLKNINLYKTIKREEPLTSKEEKFIRNQLKIFEEKLEKTDLIEEHLISLKQKFDYLNQRLDKKYPKIDWLNIFIGTIVSIIAIESIEAYKETGIMENLKELFYTIIKMNLLH